jgi:phage shock protein C
MSCFRTYFGVDSDLARVIYVVVSIVSVAFPGMLVHVLVRVLLPEGDQGGPWRSRPTV